MKGRTAKEPVMLKELTSKFIIVLTVMMTYSLSHAETSGAGSPCYGSVKALEDAYFSKDDTAFKRLLDSAFKNMQQLPPEYPDGNPWIGKKFSDLTVFLNEWCTFLPTIDGTHDDGLKYIQDFAWFYYQNPDGVTFVQQSPGREIMRDFVSSPPANFYQ